MNERRRTTKLGRVLTLQAQGAVPENPNMWSAIEHLIENQPRQFTKSHRLAWTLASALVVGLAVTAVLFASLGNDSMPGDSGQSGVTIVVDSSGYFVVPSTAEASRRADLIVIAEVMEPLDAFWNTADGKRPEMSDEELVRNPRARIFTPQVLQVNEVLKGPAPVDGQVVLTRLGGQVGSDQVVVEDDPQTFEQGDTVLAFLRDCGQERSDSMGSEGFRYVLIDRYVVDGRQATEIPIPMEELRETIEQNRYLEPRAETSC